MASITAIELGGDTCALARTTVRGVEVAVWAAEQLTPTAFPGLEAFSAALRKSRRAVGLARRSRVVLWGLPDGANRNHPAVKAVLAPLTHAGFKVERVVSPCNALAALARVKSPRGEGATCWVAINRAGVAVVVVRPGKQIYAHSFPWDSTVGFSGSQARLLQRYSLVSFLSPEIRRAMAEARANGFPVEAVVTCGNLPDLRSLTMPLIEDLDTEVETLDSLEGLIVAPTAAERLTESAAAIRLACAGAITRASRPWDVSKRAAAERKSALIRIAAVLALLAGIAAAYAAYAKWREWRDASSTPVATVARAPSPSPRVATSTPPRTSVQPPVKPPATAPPPSVSAVPTPPAKVLPAPAPAAGPLPAPPARENSQAVGQPTKSPEPDRPPPPLLRDPLPRVTAILISNGRRFATVDGGQIVGIGDAVGRRVVVDIDERALILREPSGVHVRVGLGGRRLGAGRAD